jgi:hypothetical protein
MAEFDALTAAAGGSLIGLAASLLLLANGRIAGISGIVNGAVDPGSTDRAWRGLFLAGLLGGASLAAALHDQPGVAITGLSWPAIVVAGLLVGFGTRLGSGCTSGHGICGIARLSSRSISATLTFIIAGMATVLARRLLAGGLP